MQNGCLQRIKEQRARSDKSAFLTILHAGKSSESLSYSEFIDAALLIGQRMKTKGLNDGDRVVIILPHSLNLYLAFAGAILVGLRPSIFAHPSPKLPLEQYKLTINELLIAAEPDLVLTFSELIVELDVNPLFQTVDDLPPASSETPTIVDCVANEPAFYQFSSGTTGLKKCVPISFDVLDWQVSRYSLAINLSERDRIISWLPIYHDMGLRACFMLPLLTGTPLVAMSPFEWVRDPVMFLKAFSHYRGTLGWAPNFCFNLLATTIRDSDLETLDLTSVRGLINCSEPLIAESHHRFQDRFSSVGLSEGVIGASYAMAEHTFAVTSGGLGNKMSTRGFVKQKLRERRVQEVSEEGGECVELVSSGELLEGVELRVVDPETRTSMPLTAVGEIAIRSPCLVSGYTNNPQSTKHSFVDGWYFTGDEGFIFDNELFVLGRLDDTLVIAGHNLYPQDVEACVNDYDLTVTGRCVAFAVRDVSSGTDQLVLVAERRRGPEEDGVVINTLSRAIRDRCDILPKDIFLVEPGWLQKSTSGKLSRKSNRLKYLEYRPSDAPTETGDVGAISQDSVLSLINSFVQTTGQRVSGDVGLDDPLLSSGVVDSLSYAGLLVALEDAFHIEIPHELLNEAEHFDSPRQIFRALSGLILQSPERVERTTSLESWHQLVSQSMIKGDAPSRYRLAPFMRDADRLQKVNKKMADRSFQLSEPGFQSESITIDDAGFRLCLKEGSPVSNRDFLSYHGKRGAIIGNSTAFGIGSTQDQYVCHNLLNVASASNDILWYNFSARSATLNVQAEIVRELVPTTIDYLLWWDWLDPLRTAIGQFISDVGRGGLDPKKMDTAIAVKMDAMSKRIEAKLDYALSGYDQTTKVYLALAPTPAWVGDTEIDVERQLIAIFDHQANQVFTKTVSPHVISLFYPIYREFLENLAQRLGFDFIDTNEVLRGYESTWLFVDRLHITDDAQKLIAKEIEDRIATARIN